VRVVVVGGGITGLTACYSLHREARAHGLPLQLTLLEAGDRLGGVIRTDFDQGLLLERGPDCFISSKPWGMQLCEELELEGQLIGTTTRYRQSFIVRHGRLVPVPQGLYLMVPGAFWPFVTSPIVSWRGKLRMALDLVVPRRATAGDESLAQFVTRRLGREALERVAQPMVGGIYTADPERLSLQATMPQFHDMEQRHGSLIRALWHNRRTAGRRDGAESQASGPRYSLFVSFKQGMQTLVDRLAARLPSAAVRLGTPVRSISRSPVASGWSLQLHDRSTLEADVLCLAVTAPQAGRLLTEVDAELASCLQAVPYASSATVNLAYRRADVAHPLNGMGFVVPVVERRTLMACSFSSVKFAGRAPRDTVLLRAFVGGAMQQAQYDRSDEDMQHAVCQELQQLLGITGQPRYVSTSRHAQAMPQYHVGHQQRVARIESLRGRHAGLVLAGNAYHGVGIPDCIHSAQTAARTIMTRLAETSSERARDKQPEGKLKKG
jgi:oxygen-dependent protoporphyrinogen oxidase